MPLRLVPLRAEVVAAVVVAAVVVAAVVVAAVVRPFKEDQEQAGDINFPIIIKAKSVRDVCSEIMIAPGETFECWNEPGPPFRGRLNF